ncbi:MAG TPA: hypothetical protein DER54_11330 [Odoribacter splanchnicus]|nr:hypothetical protein [Odoribacter splanchnicus]
MFEYGFVKIEYFVGNKDYTAFQFGVCCCVLAAYYRYLPGFIFDCYNFSMYAEDFIRKIGR